MKILNLLNAVSLALALFMVPTTTSGVGFKAPKLGTAEARVGGGRRGESELPEETAESGFAEGAPEVWVLTPAAAGLTVSASPSLYYYLSDNTGMALDVTINLDRLTLFQLQVNTPKTKGIYKVSLAELGMQLEEGKEYEWNVVLIPDPAQGSLNITSTGAVKRVPIEKKLEEMLIEKKSNQYEAYAENGIWYEALDELNQKILANPKNTKLKTERSDLLKQVGLPSVADMLMQ